jgi:hypothetical protein
MPVLPVPFCLVRFLFRVVVCLLVLLGAQGGYAQEESASPRPDSPRLEALGHVAHAPIGEISGMVRSRWQDNVWWVHNDSGDSPRLFAVDSTGAVHRAPWSAGDYAVGAEAGQGDLPAWPGVQLGAAAHIDYEDIAVEDRTLYLGDIGNNGNARRDLGIYVIREPFRYDRRTRPVKHMPIRYPDQTAVPAREWHFDAESLFVDAGTLYVLTKHRTGQQINSLEPGTKLYRLDTTHAHEVNTLTLVDRHATIPPPTAAALSPSGDRLAVLGSRSVWIFPRPAEGSRWLSTEPRRIEVSAQRSKQAEALTWDDARTLRIANEQREVYRLRVPVP